MTGRPILRAPLAPARIGSPDGRIRTICHALGCFALAPALVVAGGVQPPLETVLNAVRDGDFAVVEAALDGGFPVDRKAPNGMTPLHVAAVLGRDEFVSLLLARGAFVDDPAQNGITPLNRAAMGGHLETMRLLIEAGAEVDRAGRFGATPLLSAVLRGQTEAVRLLLAEGADPDLAAANGDTALGLAREHGRGEIEALLARDPETVRRTRIATVAQREARAETHFRTGVALEDAGETARAIGAFRLALEQAPDDPLVRYRLGRALHRFGEREALLHLGEAVRGWEAMIGDGEPLSPIVRPALEDACLVLRAGGRDEDAARCETVLARLPSVP